MSEQDNIGGNAEEKTARGFSIYGRVIDSWGSEIRVKRSSAMGEPRSYVFVLDSEGREFEKGIVGCRDGISVVSPHLTAQNARDLAKILTAFADDAEGVQARPTPPPRVFMIDRDDVSETTLQHIAAILAMERKERRERPDASAILIGPQETVRIQPYPLVDSEFMAESHVAHNRAERRDAKKRAKKPPGRRR